MMRPGRFAFGFGASVFVATVCAMVIWHPVRAQPATSSQQGLRFTGVNFAGSAFGAEKLPGKHRYDYFYPEPSSIDYFAAKGMNIIRLAVRWERIQHRVRTVLVEEEMQRIDAVVSRARSKGMKTIIDVHNYAAYHGAVIGTRELPVDVFVDLWRRLALRYRSNESVIFGLMNEPKGLRTETWLEATNAAIADIRKTGARNLIMVPGNGWSSARDWVGSSYGTSNSTVMLDVLDPGRNYVFEVHQYFDRDFTGTHAQCQSEDIGVRTLTPFTRWAREHGRRGFLGEFGVGSDQTCLAALDNVLRFLADNSDVWLGWTFWAAGPWAPDYYTSIEPIDGKDRPQMTVLAKYLRPFGAVRRRPK